MKPKVIRLELREVSNGWDNDTTFELYRKSDGRRECLPFDTPELAIKWAQETELNGTVYTVDIASIHRMDIAKFPKARP